MARKSSSKKTQRISHAMSVRQPWAELIVSGKKNVENRSRRTHHRGPVAIHASLTMRKSLVREEGLDPDRLLTGHVIGVVEIVACVDNSRSRWAEKGRWHWVLRNPRRVKKPIKIKGQLGIYPLKRPIRG